MVRRADLHPVPQHSSDPGEGNEITHRHVEGATAHLEGVTAAVVDIDELDPVGVGVRSEAHDPGHHHTISHLAGDGHGLDGQTQGAERVGQVGRIAVDVGREFSQPGEQYLHDRSRSELPEEPDVVVDQLADVVEPVAHHGQTVDAETEGETLPLLRVDSAVA